MAKLTANQILEVEDLPFEDVIVPEWGDMKVRISALSGAERDVWQRSVVRIEDDKPIPVWENFCARLLVRCIVDPETGDRVFKDGHAEALGKKSGVVLNRLATIALRLSRLRDSDVAELGKGSALSPSADSGSA